MREILFRGKRIYDGKWSESVCPNGEMHSDTITYDYDRKTVCEYTGLTDKNGKKIFEGDILKLEDKVNGGECVVFVEFGNPNGEYNWGFQLVKVHGDNLNTDILLWVDMEETGAYAEIIGNIFDDSELLTED